MQISNTKATLNIYLTDVEKDMFNSPVWVEFSIHSVNAFMRIASDPSLLSAPVRAYINTYTTSQFSGKMTLQKEASGLKPLKNIPLFGSEAVLWVKDEAANGTIITVQRPAMTTPKVARERKEAPITPASTLPATLPKVEPAPARAELTEASTLNGLRTAVALINNAKGLYGDDLILSVDEQGKLSLLLEIR